jgi:hypothetical protein
MTSFEKLDTFSGVFCDGDGGGDEHLHTARVKPRAGLAISRVAHQTGFARPKFGSSRWVGAGPSYASQSLLTLSMLQEASCTCLCSRMSLRMMLRIKIWLHKLVDELSENGITRKPV